MSLNDPAEEIQFRRSKQFIPIALTLTNRITNIGTYEDYIPAGQYICKPFDYAHQVQRPDSAEFPIVAFQEATKTRERHGMYQYIGGIYQSLYPYSELRNYPQFT